MSSRHDVEPRSRRFLCLLLTLRRYGFAHAGKFAPDIEEAVVAIFIAVDVAEARDGGVAYVGRGIGATGVDHLMVCDDEVASVSGDHVRSFGQVDTWGAVGECFEALAFEVVFKEAMRTRPDGEVAAVGFGYVGQVDDGEGRESAAVHAFWHAICAGAHAVEMAARFGRDIADYCGKSRGDLRASDGFLQVAFSHEGFGEGDDRAGVEEVHDNRGTVQVAAELRCAMFGHVFAIWSQGADGVVDGLTRGIDHGF